MKKFQMEINNKYISTKAFQKETELKETELKRLIEIWLVILFVNFYQDVSFCHILLNGNAFQWFQVCQFYLIVTWYLDLKNGSSRQLFFIPQSYRWGGNVDVEFPVLRSEMCWFILTLNLFVLSPIDSPIYVSFSLHIWHFK